MPHIFRFHRGRNNNIYDWAPSDRIQPLDVRDVIDKSNILTSSAGTSIPTPIARMYLFKTAFEITAAQVKDNSLDRQGIYPGIVSETLDLLELLYKSGADETKFRYHKWIFENTQRDDNIILNFFGQQHGHRLLAESFKQAASQTPFNNRIEITLIYYKEAGKEVLVGGTSPFTLVFTTPNFKRKMQEKGFRLPAGLVSNDTLFDLDYKQLYERDSSFIKYIETLFNTEGISDAFGGFSEYVTNTRKRHPGRFNGIIPVLKNIQIDNNPLSVSNIILKQISDEDYKTKINNESDFKIALPEGTGYTDVLKPLFLLDRMSYEGQYTSADRHWSTSTRISEGEFPETRMAEIMERELPGVDGFRYPFFSAFDFFEPYLIKLPGYALNNERFLTLTDEQFFVYPIKPIFFQLFPINKITDYLSVEQKSDQVTFIIKIPVYGPTKPQREFICRKTYDAASTIAYGGILGIFPLTRTLQPDLLFINKYTVAAYEKTISPLLLDAVKFFKKKEMQEINILPVQRSYYVIEQTKTTYYQINESFDVIQLNFKKNNAFCGGIIIPKFVEVEQGNISYVYAIDFGTSNTHVEYGRIENNNTQVTYPFSVDERSMQMTLLNKPKEVIKDDGAEHYMDYERSMGYTIDSARKMTLREFMPFQVGNHSSASIKFPFRSATCEGSSFTNNQGNNRLFLDANIGFNIDEDALMEDIRYKTDLKWLLEESAGNPLNISRVALFFRQLLLMIRTKVLLEEPHLRGDITQLKLALSFPLSMGSVLKSSILDIFNRQAGEILGESFKPIRIDGVDNRLVTESIAPYYQLKSTNINIQNNSYCNIDIGGGTTDIVLIDRNPEDFTELFAYCSSFRFAGRQLWSSGSNEFNSDANGFLLYYKSFIEKTDPGIYNQLERILHNKSMRTEDIIGLLFSKPGYKFTQIFTECPELKAVLLIHYSAILFYITQLAHKKGVELPRVISFSGKGSEYLSLLFPSNTDLKGFTQKALHLFSGNPMRQDFLIERSDQPKVITAKGVAHFATENIVQHNNDWGNNAPEQKGNEKRLTPMETSYIGLNDSSLENTLLTYSDISGNNNLFANLMDTQLDFFNKLFDDKKLIEGLGKRLAIKDFAKYKSFFIPQDGNLTNTGKLRDSFLATISNLDPTDTVTDSPFFFALNYSLIELSVHIALSTKKA